ncbi:MAG: site-specific integrase [Bacteroidales bacterium]|nr:site-specific integrase [Bacteroidales bacterium]
MSKATKLPSGKWRCRAFSYTDAQGKKHYESFTASTKKEAEALAAKFSVTKEREERSDLNFKQAMDFYIEMKEPVLSPSTIRGYDNMRKVLEADYDHLCRMNVTSIKKNDLQRVINDISGKKSPKTVRNYNGFIMAVIKQQRDGFDVNLTLPQKQRPELHIPTDAEIKLLLKAIEGTTLEIPVLLAAFGLMRRGEICAASIEDIDGTRIHIKHSLVKGKDGKHHKKAPKTYTSDRYVELPQFVIDKINAQGYICNVQPHTLTVELQEVLKKNNIPSFRFHDLRHYSCSIRSSLGIPTEYILKDGGWKTDYVMKNVYRHTLSDKEKEFTSKTISHFNSLIDDTK